MKTKTNEGPARILKHLKIIKNMKKKKNEGRPRILKFDLGEERCIPPWKISRKYWTIF